MEKKRNIDYVGKEIPANKKEADNSVCYFSKLLQKPFDSMEDLRKAEEEYKNRNALELKKKEERKEAAKKVEDAYKALVDAKKEAAKIIDEAEKKYLEERNSFIEKYGSFHLSMTSNNNGTEVTVSDLVDRFFTSTPKLPFFNDFFDLF